MQRIREARLIPIPVVHEGQPLPLPAQAEGEPCPMCKGAGALILERSTRDEIIPCPCTGETRERKRAEKLCRISTLDALQHKTFTAFDTNVPGAGEACEAAARFAETLEGWLILAGPVGCGKTHLAAAIAHEVLERGEEAIFLGVPDLLAQLRRSYGPNGDFSFDEVFELVRAVRLLVLDDLGVEQSTPWAREKLYQIINHRYNWRYPTVFTTNRGPGAIEERIASRMWDWQLSTVVRIRGKDFRRRTQ